MPLFSIILPTYNRGHLLPKAIQSVINQTFPDWELIIVDDGSTDSTKELVGSYSDKRIRYIYQENQERSTARNNGIENARGDFICFLDSDDYFLTEKFANLKHFIEQSVNRESIFYDGILIENDTDTMQIELPIKKENENIFEFLLMNPLFSQQICAHLSVFEKNKYDPSFRIGEDLELWLRLAENYNFIPVFNSYQTIIVEHEDRSVNIKRNNSALEHLKLLNYLFDLNVRNEKFNKRVKKNALSNCYFNIGKYYMYQGQKRKALKWIIAALKKDWNNLQRKHRIYCVYQMLLNKIPKEYNLMKVS